MGTTPKTLRTNVETTNNIALSIRKFNLVTCLSNDTFTINNIVVYLVCCQFIVPTNN